MSCIVPYGDTSIICVGSSASLIVSCLTSRNPLKFKAVTSTASFEEEEQSEARGGTSEREGKTGSHIGRK